MVKTIKNKLGTSNSLFQPLRIIEFESDFQEINRFLSVKSARLATPLHNISMDPVKMAMVLFMNEILAKTLADDYTNNGLFYFLKNSIILLDDAIDSKNFHVWWLIEITRHYGFYPNNTPGVFFDLQDGEFKNSRPLHPHYLHEESSARLRQMLDLEWPQAQTEELHSAVRKELLQSLVTYLKLHLNSLREIKSLDVLHAVFH